MVAAAFSRLPRAGVIDQDAPHQPGGHREEVGAVLPFHLADVDQAQVRLVDERGRLERVPGALPAHLPVRETAQLLVHQGNQLLEGRFVARAPGDEQTGDLGRRGRRLGCLSVAHRR